MSTLVLQDPFSQSLSRGIQQAGGAIGGALQQQGLLQQQEDLRQKQITEKQDSFNTVLESVSNLNPDLPLNQQLTELSKTFKEKGVSPDFAAPILGELIKGQLEKEKVTAISKVKAEVDRDREDNKVNLENLRQSNRIELQNKKIQADILKLDKKDQDFYRKEVIPLNAALKQIDVMEEVRKRGNLGFGATKRGSVFRGDTARDVGEYVSAGKSLINQASSIKNIKNIPEFKTLSEKLIDPNISDNEAKGVLISLRNIIMGKENALGEQFLGNSEIQKDDIVKEQKAVSFEKLPPAKDFDGREFTDTKTGNVFKSNGLKWTKQ